MGSGTGGTPLYEGVSPGPPPGDDEALGAALALDAGPRAAEEYGPTEGAGETDEVDGVGAAGEGNAGTRWYVALYRDRAERSGA